MSAKNGGLMLNKRRVGRFTLGILTMLIIVALAGILLIVRPPSNLIDGSTQSGSAVQQRISQNIIQTYCPAQMALADSGTYGDSEYQTSEGNITSSSRQAAFGSIFDSSVTAIGSDSDTTSLQDPDPLDEASVLMSTASVEKSSLLQSSQLLKASTGEGAASSVASWASEGDLRGVSAAGCVSPSLDESFLLPSTQAGSSQQLVVANPSSKSTTVNIRVWGSKEAGSLALSTASTITVGADDESVFDVSAAAANQDALYVTVSSKETPIASVVRITSMDGLTPHGSEYATPVAEASQSIALPGANKGDEVSLSVFSQTDTSVNVAWMTENGLSETQRFSVTANKVQVNNLGKAPDDALGISVTSDESVQASAMSTVTGNADQQDFGLVASSQAVKASAITIPDHVQASVVLANTSNNEASVTLSAFDTSGKALAVKQLKLGGNAAASVDASSFGNGTAAITLDDPQHSTVWTARVTQSDVDKAKVAGLGFISQTALMPRTSLINANQTPGIVQ
ncbi:MAG: DUF5719 family protein [Bifidobacterium sp.]|nr:DUF5719 family protein [Bifidobacterium sp.]MCH4174476.1 DUF5719 family protein [Bifidobacterium sp.]